MKGGSSTLSATLGHPVFTKLERALSLYKEQGFLAVTKKTMQWIEKRFRNHSSIRFNYHAWIVENEPNPTQLEGQKVRSGKFGFRPLISILMPVYNTPVKILREAVESVMGQTYDRWELCLVDGNSQKKTKRVLERFEKLDTRIRCKFLEKNLGISGNTNEALRMSRGEYINLMDHDDCIPPFALYEVVRYINENLDAEIVYGDEDRLNRRGKRCRPFFKPDWDPLLLQSFMYIGHATYRRDRVVSIGGFRSEYDFSQDYDLALRLSRSVRHVGHVQKILYHWREIPGSAAARGGKSYARESNLSALNDYLRSSGYHAKAQYHPSFNQVTYLFQQYPRISIIIPSDDMNNILKSLDSLMSTNYPDFEVLVVTSSDVGRGINSEEYLKPVLIVPFDRTYNFSAKCNLGADRATGEYVMFLNDDVYHVNNDWLMKMLGPFQRKDVGATAAKLIYKNDTIQHAGLVTGVRNFVGTAFHCFPSQSVEYNNMVQSARIVSAVSAACTLMRRDVFQRIGGFDETNVPIMHSDVDLSFRIREAGLKLVYVPEAELTHVGHLSIGKMEPERDANLNKEDIFMLKRWAEYIHKDPYFTDNMRDMLYADSPVKYRMHASNTPGSMDRKPDFLIQTHDLSYSGVPIIAHDHAVEMVRRGSFVTFISATHGDLEDIIKKEAIPLIIDPLVLEDPFTIKQLLAQFDAIVANTILSWKLVLTAVLVNIPVLWIVQEGDYGLDMARNNKNIQKALAQADKVVFPSSQTLNKYSEVCAIKNPVSLFFGVELPAGFQKTPRVEDNRKLNIIHVGSIEPRKGQDILVRALKEMTPDVMTQIETVFIGRTLDEDYYSQLINETRHFSNIHWLGSLEQDDVWAHIERADIFVCSSRDETGPLVVYQGMCLGKTVITTPVGAMPEIIENGVNGLVFPVDDHRRLASILMDISGNREVLDKTGKQALISYNNLLTKKRSNDKIADLLLSMAKRPWKTRS